MARTSPRSTRGLSLARRSTMFAGQKIEDPDKVLTIAGPTSTIKDKKARIFPFKVMRGKQAFDPVNKTLMVVHQIGDDGYWKPTTGRNPQKSACRRPGCRSAARLTLSKQKCTGESTTWSPKRSEALSCLNCHGDEGRMNWKELGYAGDPMVNPEWARGK